MNNNNNQNDDSTQAPAPAVPVPGATQKPDLLSDIRPGGFVEQILGPGRTALNDEATKLHDKLCKDLVSMQEVEKNPRTKLESWHSKIEPAHVPWHLVHAESGWYKADPVLRYCLQCHWQIDDSKKEILNAAWTAYLRLPDEYDQCLGSFIPESFRAKARRRVSDIRFDSNANLTAADDWPVYRSRLQGRRSLQLQGVTTGLPTLDFSLRGLRGLTYLGGGPGIGKTSLALFMAVRALSKHPTLAVLFYGLDMPKVTMYDRILCMEAGITYSDLIAETLTEKHQRQIEAAEARLQSEVLPRLRIVERLTPEKGESLVQSIKKDVENLLDIADDVFVIVDYLQLLEVPATDIKTALDADFYRVGSIQKIQQMSRTSDHPEGIPFLVICEVRKGETGRTELSVSDLMGSARLGYSGESVLLLDRSDDDMSGDEVPVCLNIAKARDGAVRRKIDLLFEHSSYQFREAPTRAASKQARPRKDAPPKTDKAKIDPLPGLKEEE